ncbi:MAG: nucleotidyltransferase family protein [Parvibaculum sp.]|nr:nucleotidyltransferase family protein [Parvibaculum sp.]
MRALLLAAGMGTRLRPITNAIPKCLVPIHGRPLLDYWLELLFDDNAIERILVNTHYLSNKVDSFVANSRHRDRIDLIYEPSLLGTGGTMVANREYFSDNALLVAHADNLTDFDVKAFMQAHEMRPQGCVMTMLAFRTDDPRSCGVLELDRRNVLQAFYEKVAEPPTNLANAAVYIVEPEVIAFMASLGKDFIDLSTEVIPHFIGRIFVFETSGYHRDIGSVESLARANLEFSPKN